MRFASRIFLAGILFISAQHGFSKASTRILIWPHNNPLSPTHPMNNIPRKIISSEEAMEITLKKKKVRAISEYTQSLWVKEVPAAHIGVTPDTYKLPLPELRALKLDELEEERFDIVPSYGSSKYEPRDYGRFLSNVAYMYYWAKWFKDNEPFRDVEVGEPAAYNPQSLMPIGVKLNAIHTLEIKVAYLNKKLDQSYGVRAGEIRVVNQDAIVRLLRDSGREFVDSENSIFQSFKENQACFILKDGLVNVLGFSDQHHAIVMYMHDSADETECPSLASFSIPVANLLEYPMLVEKKGNPGTMGFSSRSLEGVKADRIFKNLLDTTTYRTEFMKDFNSYVANPSAKVIRTLRLLLEDEEEFALQAAKHLLDLPETFVTSGVLESLYMNGGYNPSAQVRSYISNRIITAAKHSLNPRSAKFRAMILANCHDSNDDIKKVARDFAAAEYGWNFSN